MLKIILSKIKLRLRLLSPKQTLLIVFVIFQPIGTISILLRFNGPKIFTLLKISLTQLDLNLASMQKCLSVGMLGKGPSSKQMHLQHINNFCAIGFFSDL